MLKTRKFITWIFFSFVFVLILAACSDQVESESSQKVQSISSEKASKINVKDYFPPLVTRNQYISPNDDGSNQIIIEVSKFAIGLNNDTERIIESTNYQGNVELGRSANHPCESFWYNFFKMNGAASAAPSQVLSIRLGLLPAVAATVGSIAHHRPPGHKTTTGIWIQFPHFVQTGGRSLVKLGL